ncbi:sensor histidine kinase [Parvicella tangerina]|uniref:histidine kinase n=1 Tax=Parvicella tangerina TaxID=2829795 RepID=A0A916JM69_9FLAO|nr:sensor histidine kinase [Parvicella tangerina]CAG5080434.1 hypothetical protein CRYO30217_01310 [Parvicella tangerina]
MKNRLFLLTLLISSVSFIILSLLLVSKSNTIRDEISFEVDGISELATISSKANSIIDSANLWSTSQLQEKTRSISALSVSNIDSEQKLELATLLSFFKNSSLQNKKAITEKCSDLITYCDQIIFQKRKVLGMKSATLSSYWDYVNILIVLACLVSITLVITGFRFVKSQENYKKANSAKQLLLSETNHRVKNNLQLIISLFRIKSSNVQDPEVEGKFNEAINMVHAIAKGHETLYKSNDFKNLSLLDTLKDISDGVMLHRTTKVSFNGKDLELSMEKALPIILIFNETVTNSIKHNEQQELSITVSLENLHEFEWQLTIADDGLGFPAEVISAQNHQESIGLDLIKSLADQIGGKVQFYNQTGAVVKVIFQSN